MNPKIFFTTFFAFFAIQIADAQFTTSYYNSINFSKFAVGYEINNRLWTEIRVFGGLELDDFTAEPVFMVNYLTKDEYDLYIGAGLSINLLTGPALPTGIIIKPFETKNFKIHIEAEPFYDLDNEQLILFGSAGIRYVLNKND